MNSIDTLKTAIFLHLGYFGAPTSVLASRLLKLIDLIEDTDEARRYKEMNELSDILATDILKEEEAWHASTGQSPAFAQKILTALKSTTTNTHDKLKLAAELIRNKVSQLTTS